MAKILLVEDDRANRGMLARCWCLEAGCDDYEIKPLEFPQLLAKLRSILQTPTG